MAETFWRVFKDGEADVYDCTDGQEPDGYPGWSFEQVERLPEYNETHLGDGVIGKLFDTVRYEKWEEIKVKRYELEYNTLMATTFGHPVKLDFNSLQSIIELVQGAMIAKANGQSYSDEFTFADNYSQVLDIPAILSLGMQVRKYKGRLHNIARIARKRLWPDDPSELMTIEQVQDTDVNSLPWIV